MNPDTRVEFLRWRSDCYAYHGHRQPPPRNRPSRPVVDQRPNEVQRNDPFVRSYRDASSRQPTRARRVNALSNSQSNKPRNPPQGNEPPFHNVQPIWWQPPQIAQPPPPPVPRQDYQTIDPDWLREVSQALGPEGVAQLRTEQFRHIHAQNNQGLYRPPQMVHAPQPLLPPQVPIPVPGAPGQMAEFARNAMISAVQGRRRSAPSPRQMNVSGQTEMD